MGVGVVGFDGRAKIGSLHTSVHAGGAIHRPRPLSRRAFPANPDLLILIGLACGVHVRALDDLAPQDVAVELGAAARTVDDGDPD